MGTGIILCGLNGVGKSTLGKALAAELNFHFIDNEELFFPKTDAAYIYRHSRTREEVEKLLLHEVEVYENFVFTAVKGDYGDKILPYYTYAVLIEVPGCNGWKTVPSKNSETEYCLEGIYMNRRNGFLIW